MVGDMDSKNVGKARVMSYEDLQKARMDRAVKEAEKEARKSRNVTSNVEDSGVKPTVKAAEADPM
ncbi:hypothetical protein LTR78_010113 [Recurvomyces mirabilis]|uniref:Uncharacterized protein n=1 Tax=Recurvomyces mirabilis TaxID=574656 RepID=A0AAE0WGB6_9PEZI|nr:hypothetical protein LTR78_010113 [Recurvomyces mirabilis]KAK5150062.1 hypothetical protein LTS14_010427 [Recurvomyces mirabilis]